MRATNLANEPVRAVPKKRPMSKASCIECGIEFTRRTDLIKRRNGNVYCSKECSNTANGRKSRGRILEKMRNGKEIKCQYCNKEFYVSASRLKNNAKYCSRKCYTEWEKENDVPIRKGFITSTDNRGKKNGRYKHGKRVGQNVNKPKVRKEVIERDGHYCLLCGTPGPGLHLHRVIYGSQGGKYEVNNCVLLCAIHHQEVHSSKKKWLPILQNHLQNKVV